MKRSDILVCFFCAYTQPFRHNTISLLHIMNFQDIEAGTIDGICDYDGLNLNEACDCVGCGCDEQTPTSQPTYTGLAECEGTKLDAISALFFDQECLREKCTISNTDDGDDWKDQD